MMLRSGAAQIEEELERLKKENRQLHRAVVKYLERDQLVFARRERMRSAQQDIHEIVERPSGFWTEGHRTTNAGQIGRQIDVRHGPGPNEAAR